MSIRKPRFRKFKLFVDQAHLGLVAYKVASALCGSHLAETMAGASKMLAE